VPDAPVAPSGKPRSIFHRQERPSPEPEPMSVPSEVPIPVMSAEVAPVAGPDIPAEAQEKDEPGAAAGTPGGEGTEGENPRPPGRRAAQEAPEPLEGKEEESEVDRILLAKEFAGLLQVPREDDEASR
jgi:hypothetical protein